MLRGIKLIVRISHGINFEVDRLSFGVLYRLFCSVIVYSSCLSCMHADGYFCNTILHM